MKKNQAILTKTEIWYSADIIIIIKVVIFCLSDRWIPHVFIFRKHLQEARKKQAIKVCCLSMKRRTFPIPLPNTPNYLQPPTIQVFCTWTKRKSTKFRRCTTTATISAWLRKAKPKPPDLCSILCCCFLPLSQVPYFSLIYITGSGWKADCNSASCSMPKTSCKPC